MKTPFTISIDRIRIIFQRSATSSDGDNNWLLLLVTLNDQIVGERKGVILSPATGPFPLPGEPGQVFLAASPGGERAFFRSGANVVFSQWPLEIGPIEVDDTDTLSIFCHILNQSSSDNEKQTADYLKFTGSSAQIIGSAIALIPAASAVGAALNELGQAIGALGDTLGWFKDANCNGLVFLFGASYLGANLKAITSPLAHVNVRRDDTQHSQDGCGHDPDTEVTISIRNSRSIRQYIEIRDLRQDPGVKSVLPPGVISLRQFIMQ